MPKKIFTYEEAAALLPEVQRITGDAVEELDEAADDEPHEHQRIIAAWAEAIIGIGVDVKGLWLVDFDTGSGYYCWRWPEPALEYYHGYDEGFSGRVKLN